MELTIKSRKLNRAITFWSGRSYIFCDLNGQPGTLGNQICAGGRMTGPTVTCAANDQWDFERECRKWYRQFTRANEED